MPNQETTMAFRPYLAFAGNCREAFTRYQKIFGGELVLLTTADTPPDAGPPPPGADPNAIMHAALMAPDALLMGADDLSGSYQGDANGICVNCSLASPTEAKRVFDALAEGGAVQQPMGETFFSPAFGMCTDRYGIPWMVMVDAPTP
jgi:PhnB protein